MFRPLRFQYEVFIKHINSGSCKHDPDIKSLLKEMVMFILHKYQTFPFAVLNLDDRESGMRIKASNYCKNTFSVANPPVSFRFDFDIVGNAKK